MMKRVLSALMVVAIIATMLTVPAFAETSSAKTYPGTAVIDAEMDSVWQSAQEFTANEHFTNHWTATTDPNTSSMKFRTLWDENYIYIWCEITDPTVVTEKRKNHWDSDCVIYHLDYANNKTPKQFDTYNAGYLYITAAEGLVQTDKVWLGHIAKFQSAQKMTATGWVVETAIPTKAIGFDLKAGDKIGFEPQYNDSNDASAAGGRVGLCTWNEKGAGGYGDTSLYGTLELVGASSGDDEKKPWILFAEAEHLAIDPQNFVSVVDNAGAIGGKALTCTKTSGTAQSASHGFTLTFKVPADGTYAIWGRINAPGQSANSLHYSVDGGTSQIWDWMDEADANAACYNSWHYFYLTYREPVSADATSPAGVVETGQWRHSPNYLTLKAGEHTIHFTGREAGWFIDQLVVTDLAIDEYNPNACEGNDNFLAVCKFCTDDWKHYLKDIYALTGTRAEDYFYSTLYPKTPIAGTTPSEVDPVAPAVTGPHAEYLQGLPGDICANTNLWKTLTPDGMYYNGSAFVNHVPSITIPVKAGDQIYATSFGPSGQNGGSNSGIRVSFFTDSALLKSVSPSAIYTEFNDAGYVTVPEGATAVNVPMWSVSEDNAVYILNLDHKLENGVCTICGTNPSAVTTAPVETTAAPVETTAAPVETTAAPVETTAAPVETTDAPVETTVAPVETTDAPAAPVEKGNGIVIIVIAAVAVVAVTAVAVVVIKKKKAK